MSAPLSLLKSRLRIFVRGLGNLMVREIEPSAGTDFSDVGYIKNTQLVDSQDMADIIPETGQRVNSLVTKKQVGGRTNLMQTGIDELNLLRGAGTKTYAIRYFGKMDTAESQFLFYCSNAARINPSLDQAYVPGERLLPLVWQAMVDEEFTYDQPEYFLVGTYGHLLVDGMQLFIDPREELNVGTDRVLDMSGFMRNGQLSADYATMWNLTTLLRRLRFDGSNDTVDFGNILDIGNVKDYAIDFWLRPLAADGSLIVIASKKANTTANTDGWLIQRTTGNKLQFILGDGAANLTVTGTTNLLQNVWHHVSVIVDRSGNQALLSVDGVNDGTQATLPAGDSTTATSMALAKCSSTFGNFDLGRFRFYDFGASGLVAKNGVSILQHYLAEKSIYGL